MPEIFIVIKRNITDNSIEFIESVWTTIELADSAILYHAYSSGEPVEKYTVIRRIINTSHRS